MIIAYVGVTCSFEYDLVDHIYLLLIMYLPLVDYIYFLLHGMYILQILTTFCRLILFILAWSQHHFYSIIKQITGIMYIHRLLLQRCAIKVFTNCGLILSIYSTFCRIWIIVTLHAYCMLLDILLIYSTFRGIWLSR